MIKTSLIALMTIVSVAGVAAPAFAAYSLADEYIDDQSDSDFFAPTVLTQLQGKGIDAVSVETWGNYIRAFVRQDDGSEIQQFFTPVTLQPVTL